MPENRFLRILPLALAWTVYPLQSATLHVWQESPNPTPPYSEWTTAAHIIQEAVDAAVDGDTVFVTNGVYSIGGRAVSGSMTNRVAINRAITLLSVNGPDMTVIEGAMAMDGDMYGNGDGAIRGVYVGTNAVLSGFTVANGHTRTNGRVWEEQSGGGAYCENSAMVSNCVLRDNRAHEQGGGAIGGYFQYCTFQGYMVFDGDDDGDGGGADGSVLSHCILIGNAARNEGGGTTSCKLYHCSLFANMSWEGGGAHGGTLFNCLIAGNHAKGFGGGVASDAILYNCTVTGNSAGFTAGGADDSVLFNSILYHNAAPTMPNYRWTMLNFSCTTPLPTNGIGNITNAPVFLNADAGDYRLAYGSPGIDAGSDFDLGDGTFLSDLLTSDLDGNLRLQDGNGDGVVQFDMGAYESPAPTACDRIQVLMLEVEESVIPWNRKKRLLVSLVAACASFEQSHEDAGVNQLRAFQRKVQEQVTRADAQLAEQWIDAAQQIMDAEWMPNGCPYALPGEAPT